MNVIFSYNISGIPYRLHANLHHIEPWQSSYQHGHAADDAYRHTIGFSLRKWNILLISARPQKSPTSRDLLLAQCEGHGADDGGEEGELRHE